MTGASLRTLRAASGCEAAAPVTPGERYAIIDIIRGFSLFGVLLANMVLTTQFMALSGAQREALPTAVVDQAALFLIDTLVAEKFYSIFSMLFGLGFAVQLARATEREVNLVPIYRRRLGVLFAIGLLHGTLLWFGDVLHIYALLGLFLLLFHRRSDRTVVAWAIGIAALGFGLEFMAWAVQSWGLKDPFLFGRSWSATERHEVLAHGSYLDVLRLNWHVHLEDYGNMSCRDGILVWYVDILWRFLLGFVIGRRLLLQQAHLHLDLFRRVLPWAVAGGIAGNATMAAAAEYGAWSVESGLLRALLLGLNEVWVFALAVGYVCALVLLHQHARWRRLLGLLAPVGRMALTSYLTHSVCILLLFYGIGFGLLGQAGTAACVLFSVLIFAVQIVGSAWWLRRFRFGPVEWLWRALTYGKAPQMRGS
jgi:uncharacterized protein